MRNSTLLKWTQNSNKQIGKPGNRNWIHPPDTLQRGHIAYLVKFLGDTEVDQPKGIEVVKEGIRKLQFNQRLRKAEGSKTPKVELTISIDGVAIQEPKTKRIMHQYPLHRISYCADDKGEKRFFSFIAKDADSERHMCFVFVSDKLAEEITLTIGQAFDLAYRRFLESSSKDLEVQRRIVLLQQRAKRLEGENLALRQRLQAIAGIKGQGNVEDWMATNGIRDLLDVSVPSDNPSVESCSSPGNGNHNENGNLLNLTYTTSISMSSGPLGGPPATPLSFLPPPVPPRAFEASPIDFGDEDLREVLQAPTVGTKLEGLLLDEDDFNPRAAMDLGNSLNPIPSSNGTASPPPLLAPPPKVLRRPQTNGSSHARDAVQQDLFGSGPFNPPCTLLTRPGQGAVSLSSGGDPFGMGEFGAEGTESQEDLENALGFLDKKLLEMKDGFSRGLAFGNDDFSLESLDPLRN